MNLLGQSLWRDEAFSAYMAKQSFLEIITRSMQDTSPPLYHFLLHFWIRFFGLSEIALRSFSVLLYILLAVTVYFFVKEVFKSQRSAVFAAILTLVNPFIFMYAFEARMYMLLMLTSVLSMWFFITRRYVLYIISTLALIYTHNFGNFVFLIQIIYYIFDLFIGILSSKKFQIKELFKSQIKSPLIISVFVILLFYLPWVPALFNQTFRVSSDFWLTKPNLINFGALYLTFIKGLDKFDNFELVLILSFVLLILRGFKRKRDEIFYFWLFLIPFIIFIISQFSNSLFLDRYLVICTPAMVILLATQKKQDVITSFLTKNKYLAIFFNKISVSSILLVIVILFLVKADYYRFYHPKTQPFRELAMYLKENYPDKQIINFYNDRLHYFELKYYGVDNKIYSPIPIPFWNGTALVDDKDILKEVPNENYILVMASENIEDVMIPGFREIDRKSFNSLYLLWFEKIK
jgi:uncharacterized membrane protein